ncbi:MAG: hypothetical protein PHV17_06600, partial [Candidatus Omnitrophica bacterium]|nr:hypothetical protein [Candidatus Omnitrophota bacterium]
METKTPMLSQYHRIKNEHNDCILFFRMGDFYEMFYDDAKVAAAILDLVLTSRGTHKSGKVPMCGFPHHSADSYIPKLVKNGLKVAICEQIEDPKLAKGIVKRDVIRIITSGTFIDETSVDSRYILALYFDQDNLGISFLDTNTGTIQANQYSNRLKLIDLISRLPIFECIFPEEQQSEVNALKADPIIKSKNISFTAFDDWAFNNDIATKTIYDHFSVKTIKGFGIEELDLAVSASGALIEYLKKMNRQPMRHIDKISLYNDSEYLFISPAAVYGLEIDRFIFTIDKTVTAMGKRKIKSWIYHPLKTKSDIEERQQAIKLLSANKDSRDSLTSLLRLIPDIEKNLYRISCGYLAARDLLALRNTLIRLPEIIGIISPLSINSRLIQLDDIAELRHLLEESINPDIPLSKPEGKIIRQGYNDQLDNLRNIQNNTKTCLRE